MSVATRLKEARLCAGYTQLEIKNKTGINNKSLSNWEKGVSSPSLPDLVALSKIYNVSTDYLLGTSNDKNLTSPKKTTTDLLDALFHDEPELLAKARNIDIKGKINEPGMVAKLTEHQKARLKDIIMFTIDEAIRNGQRTLVRIHSSKEGSGDHASTQSN